MNIEWKETELGLLPKDWEVARIEDLLEVIIDYRGKTPEKSDTGILTLSAKSVRDGYIDYDSAYFISPDTYKKFMVRGFPKKGDILMTTEAPLGTLAKLDRENVAVAQRLLTLRGKKEILDNDYLMYYLKSNIGQYQLTSRETGTTVTGIKQKEFRNILIIKPKYQEQKRIAEILSSLDDKIELNNKMNKTLEEMAQAIFKQWFVDFEFPDENGNPYKSTGGKMIQSELGEIPEGWSVGKLGDIVELSGDNTCPGAHLEGLPYVPIDIIPRKKITLSEFKSSNEANSSLVLFRENDILFGAMRSYFHKVVISPFDGVTRKTCFIFRPKKNYDLSFCLLTLFQESTVDFSSQTSKGSTMPYAVYDNGMDKMNIILPSPDLRESFNNVFLPIIEKLKTSLFENQSLTKTRDELLPKLMSGEIRV